MLDRLRSLSRWAARTIEARDVLWLSFLLLAIVFSDGSSCRLRINIDDEPKVEIGAASPTEEGQP